MYRIHNICDYRGITSKIDHFLVSHDMSLKVKICEIIDMHLFSDHIPLKLEVDIYVEHADILPR